MFGAGEPEGTTEEGLIKPCPWKFWAVGDWLFGEEVGGLIDDGTGLC